MAERGDDDGTPEISGIVALALGIVAWVSFLLAFFMADDPFLFLLFALVCGAVALAVGLRARRDETAAAAMGGAAAGAALLWGVSVVAILTAMVYATGVLLFFIFLFFLAMMFAGNASASSGGGGCSCPDCDGCCDCGCTACECGDCCGGCGCGDCGGCGCVGFGMVLPAGYRPRSDRFAHHPDTPEFAADVYLVRGVRYCIGCFTTYPTFLAASATLVAFPVASTPALLAGAALALAQAVSAAGLARTRALKAAVKTCLGVGLALVVAGILSAAWLPALKVAALLAVLGLAWLSTIPRARRMRKARGACVHQHQASGAVASSPHAP